jgi:diaminopimelate epimerase
VRFRKYQGLGNDYIVLERDDLPGLGLTDAGLTEADAVIPGLPTALVRRICDRHFGVGSDGILVEDDAPEPGQIALRILNPDGSEAEKSGNGLRIFSRFLWDEGLVRNDQFTIETLGGPVTCRIEEGGKQVTVEMGHVSFLSNEIPVTGRKREVLREEMTCAGRTFAYCAATIGNPHCVVLCEEPSADFACRYGPLIERDARFPNRTNVQFMRILNRGNIHIEIWERGAGYTLASGSSATAAAAIAHKLGLCDAAIVVHMPGGSLDITLSDGFAATMR